MEAYYVINKISILNFEYRFTIKVSILTLFEKYIFLHLM